MIQNSLIKLKAKRDFESKLRMTLDKAIIEAHQEKREISKLLVSQNDFWILHYSENLKYKGLTFQQSNLIPQGKLAVIYKEDK